MKYFIANWKANKNLDETKSWVDEFFNKLEQDEETKKRLYDGHVKVIICPPFPLIHPLKELLANKKNVVVGSQDISKIEGGTYTGETTAHSLSTLVEYTILGHSERKKYLNETDDDVMKKCSLAKRYGIEPIYCMAKPSLPLPPQVNFLCYEPPEAISKGDGLGNNEPVSEILKVKTDLQLQPPVKFIYGGSVNKNNAKEYLQHDEIDGFLIGGASLDPLHFYSIVSLV